MCMPDLDTQQQDYENTRDALELADSKKHRTPPFRAAWQTSRFDAATATEVNENLKSGNCNAVCRITYKANHLTES